MATRRRTGAPWVTVTDSVRPDRALLLPRRPWVRARSRTCSPQVGHGPAGGRPLTANSSRTQRRVQQECPMKRALVHLLPGALVAAGTGYAPAAHPAPALGGLGGGGGGG